MNMSVSKPFEEGNLHNVAQVVKNSSTISSPIQGTIRTAPVLPPKPSNLISSPGYGTANSFMPYAGYGGYNSYGSYGMPYRSPYSSFGSSYGSYGSYNSYNGFGSYPAFGSDDHERRFIQYAEESSRNTFANVESIVRAFNSIAMMLDNTFFAMTSSFRAVLSVAENFGRLRTMFGHIWYSVNIFRFISWLYKKLLRLLGYKIPESTATAAWKQASGSYNVSPASSPSGSNWPTIAFLGMLISAPYIISKFLPKYEDKGDPANWKSHGIQAKAAFDYVATNPNELTVQTNDLITLAPTYIQEEMHLKNTGWAFAVCRGKSGVVPLNYLVISKNKQILREEEVVPIPRSSTNNTHKQKRVSFGETQVFENVDLNDYVPRKGVLKSSQEIKDEYLNENIRSESTVAKSVSGDSNNNSSNKGSEESIKS